MCADDDAIASDAIELKRLNEKACGHNCEERNDLLFSNSVLRERLRCWSCVFLRYRAAGLVGAAIPFASLLARRIRENAGCSR